MVGWQCRTSSSTGHAAWTKTIQLVSTVALVSLLAACQSRSPETTGSIGGSAPANRVTRNDVDALGAKYNADPSDIGTAMRYARALRATEQKTQAVAVLQQAALRSPKDKAVLAAYGKSLAEVGRLQEAAEVLQNAHTPSQPDWRVLSAQGTVADQMGEHARAQAFYDAALKIAPDEPSVLSNLGLSYLLSRQLDLAETTLRRAANQPQADARVRQNLALSLGLKGRFDDAEAILRQDLTPEAAADNVASMRGMIAQQNGWKAIRAADKGARKSPATPNG